MPIFSGGSLGIIPTDQRSWPGFGSADPIWKIVHAIALAEGYNKAGSNPAFFNNPGDISDYRHVFGSEHHSGSDITHFPEALIGFALLYLKIKEISIGMSTVYSDKLSWLGIAKRWAGDWQPWLRNVTTYLGVTPESTLVDYVTNGHVAWHETV